MRPKALTSAAAAVLHGADPATVADIDLTGPDRHYLAAEVRELADLTGMPVPYGWREEDEEPPIGSDPSDLDDFQADTDIGIFP
jgi:hypothetical protein